MKSTDVIQPVPMQTAIAVSGSRDIIPQNQTDAQEPFFCSIENGFPDITMKALNEGGRPPRGQGANGLFYLSTDQRVFLQNGGIITFNNTVSNLIGGYPQGAVLAFKQGGLIQWLESLIDDNTYNFNENNAYIGEYWQPLIPQLIETSGVPDVVIIGNPTIQEGQVSGFSASDYVQYPIIFNPGSYNWEINLCFTTGADVSTQQNLLDSTYGIAFAVINGKFVISLSSNGSSWDIAEGAMGTASVSANTTYYTKLTFDGAGYKLSYSTDNSTFTDDITVSSADVINPANLLFSGTGHPFGGSINLNNCNIWINGVEVWTGIDDIGLATKANIDLSNLSAAGEARLNKNARNIGEYVYSTLPLSDAALHLLDGSLVQGSGIYSEFVNYIAGLYNDNPSASYFTTEEEWQTAVSEYGVCGKYVYSSADNTVRLPRVTGFVEGTITASALGDLVEAGLPNITAHYKSLDGHSNESSGAFANTDAVYHNNISIGAGQGNYSVFLDFDASLSNSIYGNSTTVQPQTILGFVYIVIANGGAKTNIQVDIDNITADLNGKADADLSNIKAGQSVKNEITGWGMPDYENAISASGLYTASNNFIAPCDGVLIYCPWYQASGAIYVNGKIAGGIYGSANGNGQDSPITIYLSKNDAFYVSSNVSNNSGAALTNSRFIPLKGVS